MGCCSSRPKFAEYCSSGRSKTRSAHLEDSENESDIDFEVELGKGFENYCDYNSKKGAYISINTRSNYFSRASVVSIGDGEKIRLNEIDTSSIDSKAASLEAYYIELSKRNDWKIFIETSEYSIKTAQGSQYSAELPVIFLEIQIPRFHSGHILKILTDPLCRLQWDDSIREIKELKKFKDTHYLQHVVLNLPFTVRELVQHVYISSQDSNATIITFSATPPEVSLNLEQVSDCIFCIQKLEKSELGSILRMFTQMDLRLPFGMKMESLSGTASQQWIEKLLSIMNSCYGKYVF
jgi:hypothetical protein